MSLILLFFDGVFFWRGAASLQDAERPPEHVEQAMRGGHYTNWHQRGPLVIPIGTQHGVELLVAMDTSCAGSRMGGLVLSGMELCSALCDHPEIHQET